MRNAIHKAIRNITKKYDQDISPNFVHLFNHVIRNIIFSKVKINKKSYKNVIN